MPVHTCVERIAFKLMLLDYRLSALRAGLNVGGLVGCHIAEAVVLSSGDIVAAFGDAFLPMLRVVASPLELMLMVPIVAVGAAVGIAFIVVVLRLGLVIAYRADLPVVSIRYGVFGINVIVGALLFGSAFAGLNVAVFVGISPGTEGMGLSDSVAAIGAGLAVLSFVFFRKSPLFGEIMRLGLGLMAD